MLIDSLTGSSGEMVAIAFKELGNTKFFGQPSAGYTTGNVTYKLPDGAYLALAEGYILDRNRQSYWNGVLPDVLVGYSLGDTPDKMIEAASRWLQEAQ